MTVEGGIVAMQWLNDSIKVFSAESFGRWKLFLEIFWSCSWSSPHIVLHIEKEKKIPEIAFIIFIINLNGIWWSSSMMSEFWDHKVLIDEVLVWSAMKGEVAVVESSSWMITRTSSMICFLQDFLKVACKTVGDNARVIAWEKFYDLADPVAD